MMIERRILEALDACRLPHPGEASDADLQDPANAELAEAAALVQQDPATRAAFARIQHLDGNIAQAMEDVDIPADLAARVKLRLTGCATVAADPSEVDVSAALNETASAEPTVGVLSADANPAAAPVGVSSRRKLILSVFTSLAALLAVSVGLKMYFGAPVEIQSRDQLRGLAREWHTQAWDTGDWESLENAAQVGSLAARLKSHPFPQSSLMARAKRFQSLNLPQDARAVAYDVTYRGTRATLLVIRGDLADLDTIPSRVPIDTQGFSVGVWKRNGVIFALVVEGKPGDYRQLLQSNQGTIG